MERPFTANMVALPFDSAAPARKARGAFFTPQPIATFLVDWAIRRPTDTVFEPSCGEAAFVAEAISKLRSLGATTINCEQLQGTDIDSPSVDAARTLIAQLDAACLLTVSDFFDVKPTRRFDAVVGNPPYVRYQAFTGAARAKALEAALAQGIRLTALASSWAAFVVHAASFVTSDGRLALVLPAELLTVNYAAPVRRFLMQRFASVRLVLFEDRVFPGVMEEVVLLLAEGQGPTDHCDLIQATNVTTLAGTKGQRWTPDDADDRWTAGLLPADAEAIYAGLRKGDGFSPLQSWGETTLGMVTGNNRYFALNVETVRKLHLKADELMKICPPGSRHLRGLSFTKRAWNDMIADGSAGYLFDPSVKRQSAHALAYIVEGEAAGVHKAYKCRVRAAWWKVPRVAVPDAFLTYMNHDTPRIVTNRAGVAYLNSIHGVTFAEAHRQLAMDLLPMAALNSVTLLGSELVGRAYGGGILKIEPKEADQLPVPSRSTIEATERKLRALRPQLAKSLRQGKLLDVVEEVDRVLRVHLKLSRANLDLLRAARRALFNRRIARSHAQ